MRFLREARGFVPALQRFSRPRGRSKGKVKIGLALGGGFARGIAHTGVLNVLQSRGIPIHCITGVSSGSIVAAAFASGTSPDEIARAGCAMRFGDIASWRLCRMGFAASERMPNFLERLLKRYRFEEMEMPLSCRFARVARTRLVPTGALGWLVDGAITMEIPALLAIGVRACEMSLENPVGIHDRNL